jgi:CspA family cold shock protein
VIHLPDLAVADSPHPVGGGRETSRENVMQGTVKWYDPIKGYGFIELEHGKDIFVHASAVQRSGLVTLMVGQKLEFEVATSRGKPCAEKLVVTR